MDIRLLRLNPDLDMIRKTQPGSEPFKNREPIKVPDSGYKVLLKSFVGGIPPMPICQLNFSKPL